MRKLLATIALLFWIILGSVAYAQEEFPVNNVYIPIVTKWPHESIGDPAIVPITETVTVPEAVGVITATAQSFAISPSDYPSYVVWDTTGDKCDEEEYQDCIDKHVNSAYLTLLVGGHGQVASIYSYSVNYENEEYAIRGMGRIEDYWHNYKPSCKDVAWKQVADESFACNYVIDGMERTLVAARWGNIVVQLRFGWNEGANFNYNSDCVEHLFHVANKNYVDKTCTIP